MTQVREFEAVRTLRRGPVRAGDGAFIDVVQALGCPLAVPLLVLMPGCASGEVAPFRRSSVSDTRRAMRSRSDDVAAGDVSRPHCPTTLRSLIERIFRPRGRA